uniref:Uncharacterized protein n=1 Tax=Urocitellus parryii TaxID=9999 RepID=A0A8D2IBC4_UROPR
MDNCGDSSDQGSWPPASCRDGRLLVTCIPALPTLVPVQVRGTGLWAQAVANWTPFSLAGPGLQGMALASSLLLASAGLFVGLLWCCCSLGWLAWEPGVQGLRLQRSAPCNICHTCPDRVAPGGLRGHWRALGRGGHGHCGACS